MKISFDLPILVRGRPKGGRNVSDIFCRTVYTADIEEISLSEMDVAFTANETFIRGSEVPDSCSISLRSYGGELYRKIAGSLEEAERRGLFSSPFDESVSGRLAATLYHHNEWPQPFGGDISPMRSLQGNKPVARPLTDEFEWRLDRESAAGLRSKTAWPRPPARGVTISAGWHAHRNSVRFESVGIRDVVVDDLELAHTMFKAQTGKLISADGEIWMKSRPPAYQVQFRPAWYKGPPSLIEVSMVTAPEGYVGDLYTQHFSLHDGDKATAAAQSIYGDDKIWREGYLRELHDFRVSFDCTDDSVMTYDYQQDEINRFGYTAAIECWSFLRRNPEKAEKLDTGELAAIKAAHDAVLEVNHILGHHQDMTDFVPILAGAWKKLGYRQSLTGGEGLQHNAISAQTRVLAYIEDRPIDLALRPPADGNVYKP